MAMSASRALSGGHYYSDHPSIYVCVDSQRLTQQAQTAIWQRKIVRAKRTFGI
jgi:hypothetical protein